MRRRGKEEEEEEDEKQRAAAAWDRGGAEQTRIRLTFEVHQTTQKHSKGF